MGVGKLFQKSPAGSPSASDGPSSAGFCEALVSQKGNRHDDGPPSGGFRNASTASVGREGLEGLLHPSASADTNGSYDFLGTSFDFSKMEEERMAAEKKKAEILAEANAHAQEASDDEFRYYCDDERENDPQQGRDKYLGDEMANDATYFESLQVPAGVDIGGENENPFSNIQGVPPTCQRLVDPGPRADSQWPDSRLKKQPESMRVRRSTVTNKLYMIASIQEPLVLQKTDGDFSLRVASLPHNALCIELRDMYRIIGGLADQGTHGTLTLGKVAMFYEWFEGFFGIMSTLFEVLEDVVFSWVEKVGSVRLSPQLAPNRRQKKQDRTKDLCWDILALKVELQKYAHKKTKDDARPLVYEIADEMELLAMRILAFVHLLVKELPQLVAENFELTERGMIEDAMMRNLRASNPGKFVIGALTRGLEGAQSRSEFLAKTFGNSKQVKSKSGLKEYKRYHQRHCDIANELAVKKGGEFIFTDSAMLSGSESLGAGEASLF